MPKDYLQIARWDGLSNLKNPRDIGFGLSKAQNVSIDKHGMIRTIGGLEDFTKVDGVPALTQTAKLCPGSGLFRYGSDHWRGTDTIVDELAADNAASDEGGEVDAVGAWDDYGVTLTSVAQGDGGIDNSGVSGSIYILKGVATGTLLVCQSAATVPGQRYRFHADLYNVNAYYMYLATATPLRSSNLIATQGAWFSIDLEIVATGSSATFCVQATVDVGNTIYIDNAYVTRIPQSDLDTNWLALLDAPNAQIDLYNVNDDSFTAGLLDFGTVSSFVGVADKINFPTTNTITDANGEFLNKGVQTGDIRIISGCTTQTANNIMFVVEHVTTGTITARGNPFTVAADEDGTVTLTKYNPVAFHYVNEALRASPANGGIALRPKHYSFADRTHFEGAGSSERKYSNWYANDVGPVKPTDIAFDAAVDSGVSGNLSAGAGWEVGMTVTAEGGEWSAGTYIIACSFIYDDGQESALYIPSTDMGMTAITEGASLTLCAKALNDYDERISGGRVYTRIDETDDPWTLLMDISIAKGARATLSATYNAWREGATADTAYTYSFISKRQGVDTYESLAGIDPTTTVEVFTDNNAFWNTSVIARNRCFIGSVRYTAEGGSLAHFRDRILYSTVGAYDTFPIDNYIDVVQGDAEDYVKLGAYGNDLLCFKQRTLYIIDISDPDPAGWQMKQDANKGKYPRRGLRHPGAYFETPHGPAWCNEFGVFLYTGNEIIELLKDKIELSEHPLAYQRYMEFDGSNDHILKSNNADLNFGAHTDFSIEIIFKTTSTVGSPILVNKGDWSTPSYFIRITGGKAQIGSGATGVIVSTSTTDVDDGEYHHVIGTFDRDGDGIVYVDATAEDNDALEVGDFDEPGEPLTIGIKSEDESGAPFDGEIALVRIWNRALSAAEVLALYAGQPVLAADQWGSQTALVTGDDSDMDTAGNWVAGGAATVTGGYDSGDAGHDKTLRLESGDGVLENARLLNAFSSNLVAGKKYRLRFDYKHIDTTDLSNTMVRLYVSGDNRQSLTDVTLSATWAIYEEEFTANYASNDLQIFCDDGAGHADNEMLIDNVTLVQIGCVLEYAPKGIGDATWKDQSGNSLDGTVVGATAINEDSWAKFYTDYSILGYHAKTNQLIIMRDCTGRWSSGQDYGDCWIIDLDTGAITTGRRIFKAKTVYSNFETDWANDLIIAEQTSPTSVTVKRWTDEPQEQAAGLIDVRFADFDMGNPAIIKIIDAFLATYKSSAAQINPLSYAVDGSNLHTAWTRLDGNFLATNDWKRLIIEPTTNIQCASIRLKMDNPTAAGVIEVNDSTIRNDPQELKLE